jgi:hypothetical protein
MFLFSSIAKLICQIFDLKRFLIFFSLFIPRIILEKLIHKSRVTPQKLKFMIRSAFNGSIFYDQRIVPIVPLGNSGIFISELFHGPSGSFKDLSLQLLPQLLAGVMTPNERHLYLVTILHQQHFFWRRHSQKARPF